MSNQGKIWDIREAYKKQRANTWTRSPSKGFWFGGGTPSASNVIQTVNMDSTGNATDFGDLSRAAVRNVANSSSVRGVVAFGGTSDNTIHYNDLKSGGNTSSFGDLSTARDYLMSHGGVETRVTFSGGSAPGSPYASSNVIDVVSPQTTGNAVDFGDCTVARNAGAGGGNETRGVCFAGYLYPSNTVNNVIDFVNFASFGNASDFGDLSSAQNYNNGVGGKVRAFSMGGSNYPGYSSQIDFVTIATTGNSSDFGDLTFTDHRNYAGGSCENKIKALVGGGSPATNTISFITQATAGNSSDFGDLTTAIRENNSGATSNNHSGITDENMIQRPSVTYMPGSGRALFNGGQTAPSDALVSTVEMFHIPTAGNAVDFGELNKIVSNGPGNGASNTRSIIYTGYSPASPYYDNTIQATTFSSLGNYFDFGDPTQQRYSNSYGNIGSPTRAIFMGGYAPGSPYYVNIIDYVTIATVGNGTDFGDLAAATTNVGGCGSSVRGIGMGGYTGSQDDTIQYVTIASTGNATDFGNLTAAKSQGSGVSSSTRGVLGGGNAPSASNVIEYVTIASTGNGTDFGDLTQARKAMASASNSNRGLFMGGAAPSKVNTVDFITIASTGDATDFGDLTTATGESAGTSDSHGGLQA